MQAKENVGVGDRASVLMGWNRAFKGDVKPKGDVAIRVHGPDGKLKESRDIHNITTTVGKNHIASRMKDSGSPNQMSHMAVGTGATAAAVGDTTLDTELSRIALTTAGGTVSTNVVTYAATYGAGVGTGALVESGVLNAASVGTLLCRVVFAVLNKGANDSMTITWTVTIN
jgi:hypothetical protein